MIAVERESDFHLLRSCLLGSYKVASKLPYLGTYGTLPT